MKCNHRHRSGNLALKIANDDYQVICTECGEFWLPTNPKQPSVERNLPCPICVKDPCPGHEQPCQKPFSIEHKVLIPQLEPDPPSATMESLYQPQPKPKLECRCQEGHPHESHIIEHGDTGYPCPCSCHGEKKGIGGDFDANQSNPMFADTSTYRDKQGRTLSYKTGPNIAESSHTPAPQPPKEECDEGCSGPRSDVNCIGGRSCGCPCHYGDAEFCVRWSREREFRKALLDFLSYHMAFSKKRKTRIDGLRARFL